MTASDYLDAADRLLRGKVRGTAGLWPRACARLMRLALEAALRDLWNRENPTVASTTMRAQLLMPQPRPRRSDRRPARASVGLPVPRLPPPPLRTLANRH